MKHLVYKTTNLVNGKYYIGVHSCKCNPCKYLGSGKALKAAIRKYGRGNFKRETLREFSTREQAFQYEKEIVDFKSSQTYNLGAGGEGGYYGPVSVETRRKQSLAYSRTSEQLKSIGKKISDTKSGVALTKSHKQKLSEAAYKRVRVPTKQYQPCEVKGLKFISKASAAAHFGVTVTTITNWLK